MGIWRNRNCGEMFQKRLMRDQEKSLRKLMRNFEIRFIIKISLIREEREVGKINEREKERERIKGECKVERDRKGKVREREREDE